MSCRVEADVYVVLVPPFDRSREMLDDVEEAGYEDTL